MRIIRIALQGLILLYADLMGIVAGFVTFTLWGAPSRSQIAIQLPVAVLVSLILYVAWTLLLRVLNQRSLLLILKDPAEMRYCWAASLAWNPLVFIPLHYLTQGYMTSVGNLAALALYQAVVNLFALLAVWLIQHREPGKVR